MTDKPWSAGIAVAAGLLLRSLLQVALFLAVAALLGPSEFGHFSAVLAIFGLAGALVGLGAGQSTVQLLARGEAGLPQTVGSALGLVLGTGLVLWLAVAAAERALLPASVTPLLILSVGIAEMLGAPLVDLCGRTLQATGRATWFPAAYVLLTLLRLAALGGWWLVAGQETLRAEDWGVLYAAGTFAATVVALAVLFARRMVRPLGGGLERRLATTGLPMAVTNAAARANADLDKALLLRLADGASAGWYSAAYRLTDLVLLPVRAVVEANLTRLFAAGVTGVAASWRSAAPMLPLVLGAGVVGGVALAALSPLLPWILGPAYADAVVIAQALAALPLVKGVRLLVRQAVLAGNRAAASARVELVGVAAGIVLNVALIPAWSWAGAVVAAYVAEAVMLVLVIASIVRARRAAP